MFSIFVHDNFNYMQASEVSKRGDYATWGLAVIEAQRIVDLCLREGHKPGMTSADLYDYYVHFGDDPQIHPVPPGEKFSAWDYAKKRSLVWCG